MFNQPKAAAPSPPPKPTKPRVFKWKTSDQQQQQEDTVSASASASDGSKTLSLPDAPPPAPSPSPGGTSLASPLPGTEAQSQPPMQGGASLEPVSSRASAVSQASTSTSSNADAPSSSGLSAADAKQTAGSLKDRIAALSGLKVDQPGAPGRAPKPWRKKTADDAPAAAPELTSDKAAETVPLEHGPASEQGQQTPAIKIDTGLAQETAPGTDTPGEPTTTKPPAALPRPSSPTDNLANVVDAAPDSQPKSPLSSTSDAPAASPGSAGVAIAMPAMPTRARGPPRKGRSGGNAPAASSTGVSPAVSPSIEQPRETGILQRAEEPTPTLEEISSPSDGPKEFIGDSRQQAAAADDEEESAQETLPPPPLPPVATRPTYSDMEGVVTGSEPVTKSPASPTKRSSVGPGVALPPPPPPPTAARAAEEDVDTEDDGTAAITTGLAQQSLGSKSDRDPMRPPAPAGPRPPLPKPVDTSMADADSNLAGSDVASPTSATDKRRSVARPPVPQGFQAPPSPATQTSFSDLPPMSPSRRASGMRVLTEPESEPTAGDGEFANPALDNIAKSPVQPEISKPFVTEIVTSPVENRAPLSPTPFSPSGGPPPLPGSRPPPAPAPVAQEDDTEKPYETNISASSAYRASQAEDAQGEEEEGHAQEFEDPEAARRQALAKRMAAMGGMNMFGGGGIGGLRKKKTLPPVETESAMPPSEEPTSPIATSAPAVPGQKSREASMDDAGAEGALEDTPASPVSPKRTSSFRPPAGAFVLPSLGKPAAAVPPAESDEADDALERNASATPAVLAQEGQDEPEAGDETITPGLAEEDEEQYEEELGDGEEQYEDKQDLDEPAPGPPPPLPTGRPPRPPPAPAGQSFIDDETDTEPTSKRTSSNFSSAAGIPDFPQPPGAHVRTTSNLSYASRDDGRYPPEQIDEEAEERFDEEEQKAPPSLPPSRPARAPPVIDTAVAGAGSSQSPRSPPVRSPSVQSTRSMQQMPRSPSSGYGHQQQASFSQLSPSPSVSSRRSSTLVPTQGSAGAPAPAPSGPAGLTHDYLSQLAVGASRTKGRELDGQLASAINDVAYGFRTDPYSFGQLVYRLHVTGEKGASPDLQIQGRIEPGCIFLAWDAKFDRGLGRSSLKVGSPEVPHVGIVCEDVKDIKKAKVKIVELAQGRHHVETYKLDDLKHGAVEVRRLP